MGARTALIIGVAIGVFVLWHADWLERHMAWHMLIEFPLLVAAGAFVGYALDGRFARIIGRHDRMGLVGFSFAAATLSFWMIPAALDAALLNRSVAAGKYLTLLLTGSLLWTSFQAAPLALQAFFVGTFVWMAATVGLVYQNEPQQLCLSYLPDAQWSAGRGLVLVALVAGVWWCISTAPKLFGGFHEDRID